MKVTTFACKHCGASVDVPDSPGTVACTYCGSRHRVSFEDGSVIARLTEKVKQLDEDVARLKAGRPGPQGSPGLRKRLALIEDGKRKWYKYASLVKAKRGKESPEMRELHTGAVTDLLAGYGADKGELINDYCNRRFIDYNPVAGYSCLSIFVGLGVLVGTLGVLKITAQKTVPGVILAAVALIIIAAGIPAVINMIRIDRKDVAKREEALKRLDEIEAELRRELNAGVGREARRVDG
jgi:DNA-directed RNA polymerase subunit RPC12/RpoP